MRSWIAALCCLSLATPSEAAPDRDAVTQAEWMVYLARVGGFEGDLPAHATSSEIAARLSRAPDDAAESAPCRAAIAPAEGWMALGPVSGRMAAWTLFHALGLHAHLPGGTEGRAFLPDEMQVLATRPSWVATREEEPGTRGRLAPQVRSVALPHGGRITLSVNVPQEGSHGIRLAGEHLAGATFAFGPCRYVGPCGTPELVFALPIPRGHHEIHIDLPAGAIVESVRLLRLDESMNEIQRALADRGIVVPLDAPALSRKEALDLVGACLRACPRA